MCVPQNLRQQGKLEALNQALDLSVYTRQILNNPKHFSPNIDKDLIEKMRNDADDIYRFAWMANDTRVNSRSTAMARDELQRMSVSACLSLTVHINIAHKVFHIASKRTLFWAGKTEEVRKTLKAWRNADRKRYQNEFGRFDSS